MGIKASLSKPFAAVIAAKIRKDSANAASTQDKVFKKLLKGLSKTLFGKDHQITENLSYENWKKQIPIRDYEGLRSYIDEIKEGKKNILWPGLPIYFSKTSGTTSGVKYIPITKDSIGNHINSARNALLMYIHETGKSVFVDKNLIFLSGSPELESINGIPTGRLSGIANHHVPGYLRRNQLPSYTTNCIEDWEKKVDAIVDETMHADMSLISGIPPWVQMYFDKLEEKTGKKAGELFPNFSLFVYGGVNFEPYRAKIERSIGRRVDSVELYPASEGFIAFQDSQKEVGLLLIINSGIFYEFIPVNEYGKDDATRISLKDVELGVNYAIILNTNAGLFGYSIGDTVKFVSLNPHRLLVTGRIKHYISAFGEHVIGEEVEKAFLKACEQFGAEAAEFTVAPQVSPEAGLPYHEWFVEFAKEPKDKEAFRLAVDNNLQELNIYYKDLISGGILQTLQIRYMQADAFISLMRSMGKLGGQNKVPRLSNDRKLADQLQQYIAE